MKGLGQIGISDWTSRDKFHVGDRDFLKDAIGVVGESVRLVAINVNDFTRTEVDGINF